MEAIAILDMLEIKSVARPKPVTECDTTVPPTFYVTDSQVFQCHMKVFVVQGFNVYNFYLFSKKETLLP
jgi:hypothetical protein